MDKEESCLLVRKASSYFYKMFFSSKEKSENSDSGLFVDEPWTFSRSSSQHSVCSCMACSTQGEWKRRPSRLLEGYDVEDFYKFDAVLGKIFLKVKHTKQRKLPTNFGTVLCNVFLM